MTSTGRPTYLLVGLATVTVALALRLAPLFWSPLPATLDGFRYVRLAESVLHSGTLPTAQLDADEFGFTLELVLVSLVGDVRPLRMAQPMVAVAGAMTPLVALAFVRRLGWEQDWSPRAVRLMATLAAFAVAMEGIYLRRTGVPDEEALALILVPLVVLAAHRFLSSHQLSWGGVTVVLLAFFPPLHNLGTLLAVLSVGGVAALHLARVPDRRTIGFALALLAGSWVYFIAYFEVAELLGLRLTYSGLLRAKPGLFVAWLIVLLVGVVWFRTASSRARRLVFLTPIAGGFCIVLLNLFTPLFPGTIRSPPLVVGMVVALVVPVILAAGSLTTLTRGTGLPLLALLAAPTIVVYYALTAALTPEFFGAVLRIQTYAHPTALILAGVTVVALKERRAWPFGRGKQLAIGVLVVALLVMVPLGFVNLDTASYPSTTFESEFAAAGFSGTHVPGAFATDHSLSRVAIHYYQNQDGTFVPTQAWLTGGVPPACPTLAQHSWTTTGAHLFPTQPETIQSSRFTAWRTSNHLVYTAGGHDPAWLVVPFSAESPVC